jgi:hypothetical protein
MITELAQQQQQIAKLVLSIYEENYFVMLFEDVCLKMNTPDTFHLHANAIDLLNDFWYALPDSRSIRTPVFFQLCDVIESAQCDEDQSCPSCGEDGGTSCGLSDCGLLQWYTDMETEFFSTIEPADRAADIRAQLARLEKFPHITRRIAVQWGTRECREYIHSLTVASETRTARQGFPLDALEAILELLQLHDKSRPHLIPAVKTWEQAFRWIHDIQTKVQHRQTVEVVVPR